VTTAAPAPAAPAAFRITGQGPVRVLLLHALTGSPDAADRPGVKGWWGPLFRSGAPLAGDRATVWTPNLPGSCYGAPEVGRPDSGRPFTTRTQAEILAGWLEREELRFDALVGGSLGGMVALELALLAPDRFGSVGVIGCGGRADAWTWGTNEVQRAILRSPALADDEAIALARRAAMLTFRSPASLGDRFTEARQVRDWLRHHGRALAGRFTRRSYLALLDAMDGHDLGRGRGGLVRALAGLGAPLNVLGIESDLLFPRFSVEELAAAAAAAGRLGGLDWLRGPHGHDSFLIEWDQVAAWLEALLTSANYWKEAANS
jgi:homoserine O-acetyltransferase